MCRDRLRTLAAFAFVFLVVLKYEDNLILDTSPSLNSGEIKAGVGATRTIGTNVPDDHRDEKYGSQGEPATVPEGEPTLAQFEARDDQQEAAIAETPQPTIPPFNGEDDYFLPGTRHCRLDSPPPRLGEPAKKQKFDNFGIGFGYQCAGPDYDEYTSQKLLPLIKKKQQESPNFGTRRTIISPTSSTPTHKRILLVGNSHAVQIMESLKCQFRDQILTSHWGFVQFAVGNSTLSIHSVDNYAGVYSPRWKENIELYVNRPLENFDAVIMGLLNPYIAKFKDTALWLGIAKHGRDHPEQRIDLEGYPHGFHPTELFRTFQGPFLYMSMFALNKHWAFVNNYGQMEQIAQQDGRTNLYMLDARAHLAALDEAGCSAGNNHHKPAIDCIRKEDDPGMYDNGHRCMGDKGGEPEIVAMELVEKLWQMLT